MAKIQLRVVNLAYHNPKSHEFHSKVRFSRENPSTFEQILANSRIFHGIPDNASLMKLERYATNGLIDAKLHKINALLKFLHAKNKRNAENTFSYHISCSREIKCTNFQLV